MLHQIQTQYEVLGRQLCEAHVDLMEVRNRADVMEKLILSGDAPALETYREELRARALGAAVPMVSDAAMAELVNDLSRKCEECKSLTEANERLRASMGAGFVEATQLAVKMAAEAEAVEVRLLSEQVQKLQARAHKLEAEYAWEYRRREEYSKELVAMRDMTFMKDIEARTVLAMVTREYVVGTDLSKWKSEQLVAKIQALEGVCGALYKDAYIEDRNKRIGLALCDVRETAAAFSERDAKIRELARMVRKFERLTEVVSAEMERFVGTTVQAQIDTLYGDRALLEVEIASLKSKRSDLDGTYREIDNDLMGLRDEMQRSRKEQDERASKIMVLQSELERLTKSVKDREEEHDSLDLKLADLKIGKWNKTFEELKVKARVEVDMANKSRDITAAVMEGYEDKAKEAADWEDTIAECEAQHEKLNDQVALRRRELKDLDVTIAARRTELHNLPGRV